MKKVLYSIVVITLVVFTSSFNSVANSNEGSTSKDVEIALVEAEQMNCYLITILNAQDDLISIVIKDYKKNGKADWVQFTDYSPEYINCSSTVNFYRGDLYQSHMIARHNIREPYKAIAPNEMGVCSYNGVFLNEPTEDTRLNSFFVIIDNFLSIDAGARKKSLATFKENIESLRAMGLVDLNKKI